MRERVARDGFAVLDRALDDVVALREAASARLARAPATEYGRIALDFASGAPAAAAALPGLAAHARAILGEDEVVLFQDLAIGKGPGAVAMPWHRDAAHLPLDDDTGLTMWVALDDAAEADGCLRYVIGSHRGDSDARSFDPARGDDAPVAGEIVATPVPAGAALVHSPRVWHGSLPSTSGRPRRAWSIWWIRPRARWAPSRSAHPYLLELAPAEGEPVRGPRFPRFG